jgi:hypothetical protein
VQAAGRPLAVGPEAMAPLEPLAVGPLEPLAVGPEAVAPLEPPEAGRVACPVQVPERRVAAC